MKMVAVAGAVCGTGVFLVLRYAGVFNRRISTRGIVDRLASSRRSDCAVLRISREVFVARLLIWGVGGTAVSFLTVLVVPAVGVQFPTWLSPFVAVSGAIVGPTFFLGNISKVAQRARRTFTYALSSYLDLAGVLLAGGAGSETALFAAARTGDSWAFQMIRDRLNAARVARLPAWRAFDELGKEIGLVDLERLAGSMQLAGEHGAKVRQSLATQAESLRTRQISEIEADAQAATERMGVPTVLLFVGFVALLGYPALDLLIGQM